MSVQAFPTGTVDGEKGKVYGNQTGILFEVGRPFSVKGEPPSADCALGSPGRHRRNFAKTGEESSPSALSEVCQCQI